MKNNTENENNKAYNISSIKKLNSIKHNKEIRNLDNIYDKYDKCDYKKNVTKGEIIISYFTISFLEITLLMGIYIWCFLKGRIIYCLDKYKMDDVEENNKSVETKKGPGIKSPINMNIPDSSNKRF